MPSTLTENSSTPKVSSASARTRKADAYQKDMTELVEQYLPLVKSHVSKIRPFFPETTTTEDLYSLGLKGLITAINQYQPDKNATLGSYASLRIRGTMLDELRRLDPMSRGARTKAKKLSRTIETLEGRLARPPEEEEVRKELGLSPAEYARLLEEVQPIIIFSLDSAGVSSNDGDAVTGLEEIVSDATEQNSRDICENHELIDLLRERITQLPEDSRKILTMYYYEDMRLKEIAKVFNRSEGRISQILTHTVLTLQTYFQSISIKP
jgi:RNA polymerase sigma factor for flagellar operon FliA